MAVRLSAEAYCVIKLNETAGLKFDKDGCAPEFGLARCILDLVPSD